MPRRAVVQKNSNQPRPPLPPDLLAWPAERLFKSHLTPSIQPRLCVLCDLLFKSSPILSSSSSFSSAVQLPPNPSIQPKLCYLRFLLSKNSNQPRPPLPPDLLACPAERLFKSHLTPSIQPRLCALCDLLFKSSPIPSPSFSSAVQLPPKMSNPIFVTFVSFCSKKFPHSSSSFIIDPTPTSLNHHTSYLKKSYIQNHSALLSVLCDSAAKTKQPKSPFPQPKNSNPSFATFVSFCSKKINPTPFFLHYRPNPDFPGPPYPLSQKVVKPKSLYATLRPQRLRGKNETIQISLPSAKKVQPKLCYLRFLLFKKITLIPFFLHYRPNPDFPESPYLLSQKVVYPKSLGAPQRPQRLCG